MATMTATYTQPASTATSNGSTTTGSFPIEATKTVARAPVPIKLEITSDNICPFCYLGYKKLLAATEQAKNEGLPVSFSITFKPFILDPTLPVDHAISKKERYAAKFGARADAIIAAMAERGKQWGINFRYDGPMRNTFLSHRLVEKAYKVGGEKTQRALIESIFSGYFEHEKDIGDEAYLAEQAVANDVFNDSEEALEFLRSDELKLEVCGQVRKAQALGITGVPFVVINGKYAVSGAQEPQAFIDIFKKIACGECPCYNKKEAMASANAPADTTCDVEA